MRLGGCIASSTANGPSDRDGTALRSDATSRHFFGLGAILSDAIRFDLDMDQRVVVVATGGLSHWINTDRYGHVDGEFNETVIR